MANLPFSNIDFRDEFEYNASRSSGAGGQNVNKVNSKIELRFHVENSNLLTYLQKELIREKLSNKISNDGYLIISNQTERSQLENKEICIKKFYDILNKACTIPKYRKASKPTFASKIERMQNKRNKSEIKNLRKPPEL